MLEHVVRQGDSLSGIAIRYYGDMGLTTQLREANGLPSSDIHEGDKISLPLALFKRIEGAGPPRYRRYPILLPFTEIALTGVSFCGDHAVLLDNTANWLDTGNPVAKPEADASGADPASYTKGQIVEVELDISIEPDNAREFEAEITGECDEPALCFSETARLKGGENKITIRAGAPLPDQVAVLQPNAIQWSMQKGSADLDIGTSGQHTIYVLMGKPYGSPATIRRVHQVAVAAQGSSTEEECVDAIFDAMDFHYFLGAPYPRPVWKIYDGATRAECNALADLFMKSCQMLGLPDRFKLGHIYPLVQQGGGRFDVSGSANESRLVAFSHRASIFSSHGKREKIIFRDFSDRPTGYEGWNNFEGTVEYAGKYYCIGERRFNSATAAMNSMVVATAWWCERRTTFCFDPGPFPERAWNQARWDAIPKAAPPP